MTDYIFDDGSIESKVLQHELGSTVQVIKVKPYTKLDDWLAEILEEDDTIKRIFLHFVYEDYALDGIDYRAEVARASHLYPQLRIVMQYEQADRASILRRANNYGISLKNTGPAEEELQPELNKLIEENKEKAQVIDYNKYSVGGEPKEIPADPFKQKSEQFKDKRRRKKNE